MGPKLGSTNELGRMESPGSKRRYREENDNCKHKRSASNGTSSLRTAGVGNLPSNRKVALTHKGHTMIIKFINLFKKTYSGDLSMHRLHTTKYEDLCQ